MADKNIRLLIIDDEQGLRDLLSFELGAAGYHVETATSGPEAVEKVKKTKFDLAISDINMPGMTGLESLEVIKKIDPDVEVIMATGYGTIEMAVTAMRHGAYDFIQKPYNVSELIALIEKALEKSRMKVLLLIYESSKAIFSVVKLEELLRIVPELLRKVVPADNSSIVLRKADGQLSIASADGLAQEKIRQLHLAVARRVFELPVEKAKETLLTPENLADSKELGGIEGIAELFSAIIFPLVHQGEFLGVLAMDRAGCRQNFTSADVRCVAIFASQLVQAMANAGLYRSLEQKMEEAGQARDAAIEASRVKSEFLATMSHEIRTPMNAIIGMAELLIETPLSAEQMEYVQVLKRGGDTLLNLINDILDLSKVEAGRLELEEADFDLRDFIERTIEFLAVRAHQKNLELACHIDPGIPNWLGGDSNRLRQVIVNLVGNAIKFTEKGEVIVEVAKSDPGTASSGNDVCNLLFSVKDTGIGIPPEKLNLIFEPFTQADSSTTRKYGGTGLGLSISKKLVELMGGRIWIESKVGEGSRFKFNVNLKVRPEPTPQGKVSFHVGSLNGLRVLIVDDNATNRFILKESLLSWGATSEEADGGQSCLKMLEMAKEQGRPFKLLLLDCRMPEMDGFEVATRIKSETRLASTVIMMLTSDTRSGDIARSKELGMAAYLVKPVKKADLLKVIVRAFQQQEPAAKAEPERPKKSLASGRSLNILLVDDAADNRLLIQSYLKKTSHHADAAVNGKEAVEKFLSGSYDLVLMDMHMPVMDGLEATRQIRELESGRAGKTDSSGRVPVIALTAAGLKEDADKCLAAGCDSHLTKPIKKAVFMELLERYATHSQASKGAGNV